MSHISKNSDLTTTRTNPMLSVHASTADIDWAKVGEVYKPETDLRHVVQKEMGRLNRAFETKLAVMEPVLTT